MQAGVGPMSKLKANPRNSWRQGEVFNSGSSDFEAPVGWPVARVQIRSNFLGEARVDIIALEKPKRERKRKISFNSDINDLSPRRGSSQRMSPRHKKGIPFNSNIRSRLLPHLQERSHHREKPDPRLRWAECVWPLFALGVASVFVAVVLTDIRLIASDTAIALAVGASVCTGILAMVTGGLSLSAPLPQQVGERTTWLTRQKREQQRQLILLPGAVLVIAAVAAVLAMAPRPYAPVMNDVATDASEPPLFDAVPINASISPLSARLIGYYYPQLRPLALQRAPPVCLRHALAAAEGLGWTVVGEPRAASAAAGAAAGGFEVTLPSRLLMYDVHDLAVRVRAATENGGKVLRATNATAAANVTRRSPPDESSPAVEASMQSCVVDVRSRSRDRTCDFGYNALLIRTFLLRLKRAVFDETSG